MLVTEGIVDGFEVIEIDEHDSDLGRVSVAVRDSLFDAVLQQNAVRQSGERVMMGKVRDALFRLPAAGDIGGHADNALCAAGWRTGHLAFHGHPVLSIPTVK